MDSVNGKSLELLNELQRKDLCSEKVSATNELATQVHGLILFQCVALKH